MEKNYFEELNRINVNGKTEKKNGLTYLSWAWAWGEVKKLHPDAVYTIYENASGWNYHTDGRTCWVKTGVTVAGVEHIEYLPVMDFRNNSIPADKVTSYDVNKAIQRSLTKACARHGLGLYIYAGEDLPEEQTQEAPQTAQEPQRATEPAKASTSSKKKTKAPEKAQETPQEPQEQTEEKPARRQARPTDPITPEMASALEYRCQEVGIDTAALCKLYKVNSIGELRLLHLRNINENWEEVKKRLAKNEEGNK